MIEANSNGHLITYNEETKLWYYADGTVANDSNVKPCTKCGKMPVNGHDACIANLPGVKNACCGHGKTEGYIHFENGTVIRGKFIVETLCTNS